MDMQSKKTRRAIKLPSKKTVNLCQRESHGKDMTTLGVGVLVIALLVVLVSRFAVKSQLDRLQQAEGAYHQVHAQYEQMEQALLEYAQVAETYGIYARTWMKDADENGFVRVDRLEVLDLVEEWLIPYGDIKKLTLRDSTLVVDMSGMNLQEISAMFQRLQLQNIVEGAALTLASTEEQAQNAKLDFSITIVLQPEQEVQE